MASERTAVRRAKKRQNSNNSRTRCTSCHQDDYRCTRTYTINTACCCIHERGCYRVSTGAAAFTHEGCHVFWATSSMISQTTWVFTRQTPEQKKKRARKSVRHSSCSDHTHCCEHCREEKGGVTSDIFLPRLSRSHFTKQQRSSYVTN